MIAWCWGFGWGDDAIDPKTRSMMNLAMLGAQVRLLTAVGQDADGTAIRDILAKAGVDVEGVLENARAMDNFGNRVRLVKDLLFGEIGIDASTALLAPEYSWLWRGTPRRTEVLLQNVRELTDESMRPGDGVWRLLIDYPFDEDPARTPADLRRQLFGTLHTAASKAGQAIPSGRESSHTMPNCAAWFSACCSWPRPPSWAGRAWGR